MLERLKTMIAKYDCIGDVRGIGLMIGIEIVKDKKTNVQPDTKTRNKIQSECFKRGVLMLGCGSHGIRYCPPLVLTESQAMVALDILEDVLKGL